MLTDSQRNDLIQRHAGLQPLWNGLQQERRQQAVVALVLLVISGGTSTLINKETGSVYLLLALGIFVIGVIWLLVLARQQPEQELKDLLRNKPDAVVWVYVLTTERLPFGLQFSSQTLLYLVCNDGREFSVPLPAAKSKLVSKTLNRVLPEAVFGYSKEKDLQYRGPR